MLQRQACDEEEDAGAFCVRLDRLIVAGRTDPVYAGHENHIHLNARKLIAGDQLYNHTRKLSLVRFRVLLHESASKPSNGVAFLFRQPGVRYVHRHPA